MEIPTFFDDYNAQVWITGSRMYGIDDPSSDTDFTGVFHDPLGYLNPFSDRLITDTNDTNDYSIHTAAKLGRMLLKGNFNAIDLIFHPAVRSETFVSGMVEVAKPYALTVNVAKSYMGYIRSQKDRLVGHRAKSQERKDQIERLGYDPKYAAHLIRGILTLTKILKTGEYYYLTLQDKYMLLDVKTGGLRMERVEMLINDAMNSVNAVYASGLESLQSDDNLRRVIGDYFISFYER